MAARTLYFRSTQSTVVSGNTAVRSLSETAGTTNTTTTSVKYSTSSGTANEYRFIPGTNGNVTRVTPGTTPSSQGWIFDSFASGARTAGTYAAGTWTTALAITNSATTGTMVVEAYLWKVTASTTAVTSTQLIGNGSLTGITPSTTQTIRTINISASSVSLASNEYLYFESYVYMSTASSTNTAAATFNTDTPTTGTIGSIRTPNYVESSPNAPTLSFPTNGSTVVTTTPQFKFSATDPESDKVSYELQLDTASTMNSGSGAGSVSFISQVATNVQQGTGSPITTSVTMPSLTNGIMVVPIFDSASGAITSVTYNGITLTRAESSAGLINFYYLINPPSGTHNLVITRTNVSSKTTSVYAFSDVNQTTPINSFSLATTSVSQATASTTLSVATAGSMGIDVAQYNNVSGQSITSFAPSTKTEFSNGGATSNPNVMSYLTNTPTGSNTFSYTFSAAANSYIGGIVLNPANAPLYDALSASTSGFSDITASGNTDPFPSGDLIGYTPSALAAGAYYWRVRAIDPTGGNAFGSWSAVQSFSIQTTGPYVVQSAGHTDGSGTSTSQTITLPAAPTVGNLLLYFGSFDLNKTYVGDPTGWQPIAGAGSNPYTNGRAAMSAIYRVVQAGDTATFTFPQITTADTETGTLAEITGQATTGFINGFIESGSSTTVTSNTSGSVTPTVAGTLAIGYFAEDTGAAGTVTSDTATISSGWMFSQREYSDYHPGWLTHRIAATTDTTTPIQATISGTSSSANSNIIVLIAPASTGSTITKTQPATARITATISATRQATARITKTLTSTQPATARITQPISALTDPLNTNTYDTTKWLKGGGVPGNVAFANNDLEITVASGAVQYNYLGSVAQYDWANSSAYVHVKPPTTSTVVSQEAGILFNIDSSNKLWVFIGNGTVNAYKIVAGTQTQIGTGITYSSTSHAYLRISHSGTTFSFDTSPDGTTWTSRWTLTNPFSTTVANVWIYSQHWQSETTTTIDKFDSFNTLLSSTLTKTQTATARVSKVVTSTQSSTARIANTIAKTQSSTARITTTPTRTQPATARITVTASKAQSSTARITKAITKSQTATARIAINGTKTQTSSSRISKSLVKTQSAIASIAAAPILTKTQTATARISKSFSTATSAVARISRSFTATQTSTARISKIATSTQPATARLTKSATKTQTSVARIAKIFTASTTSVARIAISSAKTQPSVARIVKTLTKTQSSTARISTTQTKNQSSTARISKVSTAVQSATASITVAATFTKTQSATARITRTLTAVQTATARLSKTLTKSQPALARIAKPLTNTQISISRIAKSLTKGQPATGRITTTLIKAQSAIAKVAIIGTKTQPATARIAVATTKTQSATAGIVTPGSGSKSQISTARIVKSFATSVTAIARIAISRAKTQSATARIAKLTAKTQLATARISATVTKTQPATSRITKPLTNTQPATARIARPLTKTQTSTARLIKTLTASQGAIARIAATQVRSITQAATARIAVTGIRIQMATASIRGGAIAGLPTVLATSDSDVTYLTSSPNITTLSSTGDGITLLTNDKNIIVLNTIDTNTILR